MTHHVVKTRVPIVFTHGATDLGELHAEERALAERLGLGEHRRAEWRAGRLAARAALAALGVEAPVLQADDGAPLAPAGLALSISHGRGFAVAAAGRVARLGIDLCEIARAPNVQRVSERFLHAAETALPTTPKEWALLWALKEAAAKAVRRGLFDGGLAASRVIALSPPRFAFPAFTVETETTEADVVAVVYD